MHVPYLHCVTNSVNAAYVPRQASVTRANSLPQRYVCKKMETNLESQQFSCKKLNFKKEFCVRNIDVFQWASRQSTDDEAF